ncbi:glutamine synthetase family protein [Amaricoccus macauensis]|uniref:glutamine synthetase family protein n=1 Tax=Amaricoccus macauensis TaxID=57001 RepID=UPI003C7D3EEB
MVDLWRGKASDVSARQDADLTRLDPVGWLEARPEISSLRAAVCDLNGVLRGKRVPVAQAAKILAGELRMPLSVTCPDIWGADVEDNPMVFAEGDADGVCMPTGRGILPMDWLGSPTAFLPLWMETEAGAPHLADPRRALADVIARFRERGLTPMVASELEFYLLDPEADLPAPPRSPVTGRRLDGNDVLSLDDIDDFEAFFADIYKTCEAYGIPADSAISENGGGQFEINLTHIDDPLRAADDTLYFKRLVKGVARSHGLAASFMAKPYLDRSGSGFHVHFSLLDEGGRNVFDDGGEAGSETLRHAVGGILALMRESALIFAPHLNSYRRWQPGSHAPHSICWGYETRHAAVRIPGGPSKARRIEHRVAGTDANPYLVLAVILGAALEGIERRIEPTAPMTSNDAALEGDQLPSVWRHGIEAFGESEAMRRIFSPTLVDAFLGMKIQELEVFSQRMSPFEIETYLERV